MQLLITRGVQTFVEVGPGKVLCGLMRQIDRSKKCVNVEDENPSRRRWFFSPMAPPIRRDVARYASSETLQATSLLSDGELQARFLLSFQLLLRHPAEPIAAIDFIG